MQIDLGQSEFGAVVRISVYIIGRNISNPCGRKIYGFHFEFILWLVLLRFLLFLLYRTEKTFPAISPEQPGVALLGKPNERGFADNVIFRDKAKQAGIREIDGVISTYPVII